MTMKFSDILRTYGNPVQFLISSSHLKKNDIKVMLGTNNIVSEVPLRGDKSLAILRLAFRDYVLKSGDVTREQREMLNGWIFDKDILVANDVITDYATDMPLLFVKLT